MKSVVIVVFTCLTLSTSTIPQQEQEVAGNKNNPSDLKEFQLQSDKYEEPLGFIPASQNAPEGPEPLGRPSSSRASGQIYFMTKQQVANATSELETSPIYANVSLLGNLSYTFKPQGFNQEVKPVGFKLFQEEFHPEESKILAVDPLLTPQLQAGAKATHVDTTLTQDKAKHPDTINRQAEELGSSKRSFDVDEHGKDKCSSNSSTAIKPTVISSPLTSSVTSYSTSPSPKDP